MFARDVFHHFGYYAIMAFQRAFMPGYQTKKFSEKDSWHYRYGEQ